MYTFSCSVFSAQLTVSFSLFSVNDVVSNMLFKENKSVVKMNVEKLEQVLSDFDIVGKVVEINALWYNALKTMEELSKRFPEGITYDIPYDTTLFVDIPDNQRLSPLFERATAHDAADTRGATRDQNNLVFDVV